MTIAAVLLLWIVVAALIVTSRPLLSRADCWWLALLWPIVLVLAAAILFYELALYRPFVVPIVRAVRRRRERAS